MPVRSSDDFIALYSQIYFACHTRHVHDPESGARVSATQASILSHLDSVEPTPMSQLASHMGVTVSTMSIAVDRLERQGYVARARAETDGRVRHIRLTSAGERLRAAQKVLDPRLVRSMLSRLSPADRRIALRGLELLGAAAREQTSARRDENSLAVRRHRSTP
jgi:DNA-binding MarR family transcriptional regulator